MNKIKNIKEIIIPNNNMKFMIFRNPFLKKEMINNINKYITKEENSEYTINNNTSNSILLNDKELKTKDYNLFLINEYSFDIENEKKLNAKSLIYQIITNELKKQNNVFEKVNSDLINVDIQNFINFKMEEINMKNIFKICSLSFLKNKSKISNQNLDYNDVFAYQLELIKLAMKESSIIFIDLPFLTNEIYNKIVQLSGKNIIICMMYFSKIELEKDNIIIAKENDYIDFLNEDYFYDTMNENITLNEYRDKVYNYCLQHTLFMI